MSRDNCHGWTTQWAWHRFTILRVTTHLQSRRWRSAAITLATLLVVVAFAPRTLAIAPARRPPYCSLPENITFDRAEHPEIVGFYTGQWRPEAPILYVRKFCILVTSIKGNRVRGIYSWEAGGWDRQSGWREIHSESSSPFSIIRFQEWRDEDELTIQLEFHKNGRAAATYTRTYRGFLGLRTQSVLQSRLVKIE
jgi:hypothetical protein